MHRKLTIATVEGSVVEAAGSIALAIICSTIFDSSFRNWEWHKGKKHRHPHLNLNHLLPKPVDA
jgi:hypothetical protein